MPISQEFPQIGSGSSELRDFGLTNWKQSNSFDTFGEILFASKDFIAGHKQPLIWSNQISIISENIETVAKACSSQHELNA